jgi:hypothetical protein
VSLGSSNFNTQYSVGFPIRFAFQDSRHAGGGACNPAQGEGTMIVLSCVTKTIAQKTKMRNGICPGCRVRNKIHKNKFLSHSHTHTRLAIKSLSRLRLLLHRNPTHRYASIDNRVHPRPETAARPRDLYKGSFFLAYTHHRAATLHALLRTWRAPSALE